MSEQWTVTMPKLGETVTEGTVGSWLKNVGDAVAFDDPLFEVSTDKVDSEIPSPYDGVIVEILVQAGETVPVGTPLVKIGEPGSTPGARGGPASSDPAAPATGGSEAMPATAAAGAGVPGSPAASGGEVHDITMPKLGETVTEGTVGSWLKNVGDAVAFDDPLFEVSTDKVDSEIPSPYDGVILEILVQAGETVPVGTPVARIGEPGAAPAGGGGAPAPTTAAAPAATASAAPATAAPATASANGGGTPLSPLVRRLAAENNLDLAKVPGSGVGGRIRREDVEKAIAGGGATATAAPAAAPAPAAAAAAPATTQPRPAAPAAAAAPKVGGDPRDQVQPLSRMRLALASGLKGSQMLAASVWTSIEVDYAEVDKVRAKHKDRFKKETGSSLSYLPFVSRAVVDALRAFRRSTPRSTSRPRP